MTPRGRWWTWNGERLAMPWDIARRLVAMPLLYVLRALLFVVVLAGWNFYEAKSYWSRTR